MYPRDFHGAIRHAALCRVMQTAIQHRMHAIIQDHAVAVLLIHPHLQIGVWYILQDLNELYELLGIDQAALRKVVQKALRYGVFAIVQGRAVAVLVEYTRRRIGEWHIARDVEELHEILGID